MSKPAAPYTTPEDFLFNTPPYDQRSISEEKVKGLFGGNLRLDGYCPYCQARRTFSRSAGAMTQYWFQEYEPANERRHFGELHLKCTRYDHVLRFNWTLASSLIQKVGQFPSFADIALDESKQYNKLLSPQDASEFHRAIGLAAHNIGIGSFVYLRRIFERLIDKRYTDFKDAEGWKDDDFYKLRMAEKITFLKDHLPSFLVKNAKIYSILSVGLHELSEAECLSFFAVLRQSTVLILEEDKKKREELKMQHELEKAISGFSMTIAVEAPTSEADG